MHLRVFHTHGHYIAVGDIKSYIEDNEEKGFHSDWYYDETRDVIFQMTNYLKYNEDFKSISKWHRIVATTPSMKINGLLTIPITDALRSKIKRCNLNRKPLDILSIDVEQYKENRKHWRKIMATNGELNIIDYVHR
jgi:hypothetical protein